MSELLICEKFSGYVSEKNEMKEQLDSAIYEAEILLKKSRRIVKGYFSQSAEIWEHYDTVELHHSFLRLISNWEWSVRIGKKLLKTWADGCMSVDMLKKDMWHL